MQTVVRAAPRDIVALIWFRLGYRPRDSLLLVGLHGPRHRTGLVVRIDLPPPGEEKPAIRRLARLVRRTGAEAAIAVLCRDTACDPPRPPAVRVVRRELPRAGLGLVDMIAVGRRGYRSYLCHDPGCCPPEGRPLAEVMAGEVAARMVLAGHTVVEDEAALIADVMPPGGPAEGPAGVGRGGAPPGPAAVRGAPPSSTEVLAAWRRTLEQAEPDPAVIAGLATALADVRLRDAILLTLVPGAGPAPEDVLAGRQVDLERLLSRPPEEDLVDRGRSHLAAAARAAPPPARADVLATLAWLAWWTGHGGRARLLADLAQTTRPGHRLAGLVTALLHTCAPPPWVGAGSG